MGMRWEQQKLLQNMHSTSSRRWCLIPSTTTSSQLQYKLTQQVASKEQKGKEQREKKIILLRLNLKNTTLARWSKWTLSVITHVASTDFWSLCIENDLISVVFFPQTCNTRRTMRKNIRLENNLQNTWPVLLKTVKVIENKECLRNCYSPEEPRETGPLNVM